MKVEGYSLGRTVGKGSEAVCKLAKDKHTHEKVVIKQIKEGEDALCDNSTEECGSPNEIHIHSLLASGKTQHAHIVNVKKVIHEGNKWYEVLEFCSQGDVAHKLNGTPTTEMQAQKWFKDLIEAVKYMHDRGICHRDIKMENCLIDACGSLKVADFGVGAVFRNEDGTVKMFSDVLGTMPYMAPEVYHGEAHDATRADIWSCGVTLLAMLAGDVMWEAPDDTDDVYAAHLRGELLGTFSFGDDLKELLAAMLSVDPARRPTANELYEAKWMKTRSPIGIHSCMCPWTSKPRHSAPAKAQAPVHMERSNSGKRFFVHLGGLGDLLRKISIKHRGKGKNRGGEAAATCAHRDVAPCCDHAGCCAPGSSEHISEACESEEGPTSPPSSPVHSRAPMSIFVDDASGSKPCAPPSPRASDEEHLHVVRDDEGRCTSCSSLPPVLKIVEGTVRPCDNALHSPPNTPVDTAAPKSLYM
eukprot:Opistho-2@28235